MSTFIWVVIGKVNVILGPETLYDFTGCCKTPSIKTSKKSGSSIGCTVRSSRSKIKKGPFLLLLIRAALRVSLL